MKNKIKKLILGGGGVLSIAGVVAIGTSASLKQSEFRTITDVSDYIIMNPVNNTLNISLRERIRISNEYLPQLMAFLKNDYLLLNEFVRKLKHDWDDTTFSRSGGDNRTKLELINSIWKSLHGQYSLRVKLYSDDFLQWIWDNFLVDAFEDYSGAIRYIKNIDTYRENNILSSTEASTNNWYDVFRYWMTKRYLDSPSEWSNLYEDLNSYLINKIKSNIITKFSKPSEDTIGISITINGENYRITPKKILGSDAGISQIKGQFTLSDKYFDKDFNLKPVYHNYNGKKYIAFPFILNDSGKMIMIEVSKLQKININDERLKTILKLDDTSFDGVSSLNHKSFLFNPTLGTEQWKSWQPDHRVVLPTKVLMEEGGSFVHLGIKTYNLFTIDEIHRLESSPQRSASFYKNELNKITSTFTSQRFNDGGLTPDNDIKWFILGGGSISISDVSIDNANRIASYTIKFNKGSGSGALNANKIQWLQPKGNPVVNRTDNTETFRINWDGTNLNNDATKTNRLLAIISDFYKASFIWENSALKKQLLRVVYKNKSWLSQINLTDLIAEYDSEHRDDIEYEDWLHDNYNRNEIKFDKFYEMIKPFTQSVNQNTSIIGNGDLSFITFILMNFLTYTIDASRYDYSVNTYYGDDEDNWLVQLKNSTSEQDFIDKTTKGGNIYNSHHAFANLFVNGGQDWIYNQNINVFNDITEVSQDKIRDLSDLIKNSDIENLSYRIPVSNHRTLSEFKLKSPQLFEPIINKKLYSRTRQDGEDAIYYPSFVIPELMSGQNFYWGSNLRDCLWFNTTENRIKIQEKERTKEISIGARFYPIQKTDFDALLGKRSELLAKRSRDIVDVPINITIDHPSNKVGSKEQIIQFITNEWKTNIGSLISRNLREWEDQTRSITVDPTKISIEVSPIENFTFDDPVKTIKYKLKYDISNNPYMSAMYNGRDYIYLTKEFAVDGYFTMNYTEGNNSAIKSFENDTQLPQMLMPIHLPNSEESLINLVKSFIVGRQIDNPFLNNGTKINENNFVNGDENPSREKFIKINLNYGALGIDSITSFDTLMQYKNSIAYEKMNKLIEIIGADLNNPTEWFTRYIYNMKSRGFENGAIEGKRNYQSETDKIIDLGDKKVATSKDDVVRHIKTFFGVNDLDRDNVTKYLKFKFKGYNDENFGDELEFTELLTKFDDQSVIDYLNDKEKLNVKKDKVKIQVIFDEVNDNWWYSDRPEIIKPSSNIVLTLSKNHSLDSDLDNQSTIRDFSKNEEFNNTIFNLDKINSELEFKEYIKTKIESLQLQNLIAKEHDHYENVKVNINNFADDTAPNKNKFLKIVINYGVFNNASITNIETLKEHYNQSYENKLNEFITIVGANLGNPTVWDTASINLKVNYPRITKGFRNIGLINDATIKLSRSVDNVSHTMLVEHIGHVLGVDNINEPHTTLSKFEFYFNQLDGLDDYGTANFTFDKLKNNEDGIWSNALNHLNDTSNSKSLKDGFRVKIKYLGNDNFDYLNDDIKLYGDKGKEIIVKFVKDHRNALKSIESISKLVNGNIKVVFNGQNNPVVDNQGNHMVIKLRKNDTNIDYVLNLDGDLWNKSIENTKSVWEFKLSDGHYDQNGFTLDSDYEVVSIGYKTPNKEPEVQSVNSLFIYNVSSSNTYKTLLSELNKYNTSIKVENQNKLNELRNYANRYNIPNRNKFIDEVISVYSQSIYKYVDGIDLNLIPNTKKLMENNEDITLLTNNLKDKLQTSSNKLDQLINLYKDEYTKYTQIYGLNNSSQTDAGTVLSELRILSNNTIDFSNEIIAFNNKNNKFDIINGENVRVFKNNEDISHDYSSDYSEEFLALLDQENNFDYSMRLEKLNESYQTITNHYQKVNESLKKLGNVTSFMKQNNLLKDKILKDIIKDVISGELLKDENTLSDILHNVGVLDNQMKTLLTLNPQYENIDKFKELFNKGKVDLNNLTNLFNEELNKEKLKVDEELKSKQKDDELAKFKTEGKVRLQSLQGFIDESLYDSIINEIDTLKYEDIAKYDNIYNSLINGVNYINENLNFEGGNKEQNLKLRKIISKRIVNELINNSKFDNIIDNINAYFVKDGDNTLTNINKYLKTYQNKVNKDISKDILSKLYEDLPLTNDWNVYEVFKVKEIEVKQEIIQDIKNKYLNTLSLNINEPETYNKVITKLRNIISSGDIESILNDIPRIYNEEVQKFDNKNKQEIQSAQKRPVQIVVGSISAIVGVAISAIVGIIVRRNIVKRKSKNNKSSKRSWFKNK